MRFVTVVCGATLFAAAATATAAGCKHGDYDGSFDGSFDAGATVDGSAVSRVVQPDKMETVASGDAVIDVTFAPGTFTQPATITITSMGEQTLDTGLIVPIYGVSADKEPAKFFQVSFHGAATLNGGQQDRALVPALETAGTFKPLPIAGTPSIGGSNQTLWGLSKTFGTYSLAYVTGTQMGGFAENAASCTAQCCHQNGSQVIGFGGGCYCSSAPDLACFLEHCGDIAASAARCTAIAASNNAGNVNCEPFGVTNCPGNPGCMGAYQGMCGPGGTTGGGGNNSNTCCIINKNSGSCVPATCAGFSARCTANTACPVNTKCCVFETESYCAADCPEAQRACASNADCGDAGAGTDGGGTCQGGGCPVGVCGTPPVLCK